MNSINANTARKADFEYKRCYIDNQGNYIDPKTTWDLPRGISRKFFSDLFHRVNLRKYYTAWRLMLAIGDGTRRMASSVSDKAFQRIKSEKVHKNNQHQATKM